ncbi:MAG: SIR2 family NAD-dependent protein deacylase [Dehalococcoidia bacterium]
MDNLVRRAAYELAQSEYAIALTGAGISTESGIPDFRGPQGIWTTDRRAEAQAYRRYELFLHDAKAYWEEMLGLREPYCTFYGEIEKAEPNPGHYALADLEALDVLKCVITQNIDGLHRKAGNRRVLEYHGSVDALRCICCGTRVEGAQVCLEELPPRCRCGTALKYDVVHFGEPIPLDVMTASEEEALKCDLMLVCGTSAAVYPFANLPRLARFGARASLLGLSVTTPRPGVRIVEVNADPTPLTHEGVSDYLIQGKTGEILPGIVAEFREAIKQ